MDQSAISANLDTTSKNEETLENDGKFEKKTHNQTRFSIINILFSLDVNIILDDDDDDVIVLPTEEPVVTEIPDEDESNEVLAAEDDAADTTAVGTPEPDTNELPDDAAATSTPAPVSTLPAPVMNYEPVGNESDLQILVPQISVLDLDDFEDKPIDENGESNGSESALLPIKIKEEPRKGYNDEDDDEDDGFEEVGTIEGAAIIDDDSGK